jgi:hypothetical protein
LWESHGAVCRIAGPSYCWTVVLLDRRILDHRIAGSTRIAGCLFAGLKRAATWRYPVGPPHVITVNDAGTVG